MILNYFLNCKWCILDFSGYKMRFRICVSDANCRRKCNSLIGNETSRLGIGRSPANSFRRAIDICQVDLAILSSASWRDQQHRHNWDCRQQNKECPQFSRGICWSTSERRFKRRISQKQRGFCHSRSRIYRSLTSRSFVFPRRSKVSSFHKIVCFISNPFFIISFLNKKNYLVQCLRKNFVFSFSTMSSSRSKQIRMSIASQNNRPNFKFESLIKECLHYVNR